MNTTNLGITGSPAFAASGKALDQNSVALSKSIASVYGVNAGKTFLDGPFMWRAHVGFFVDYTVALSKNDKAGQDKAVANLQTYTVKFGDSSQRQRVSRRPQSGTTCSPTSSS